MITRKRPRISTSTWDEQKANLKFRFPKLTDEDLEFDQYHKADMLRNLEFKLALTSQELRLIMK